MLVPLVLAGEAAAPLAALVGDDESAPTLLVVNNPRNRTQRFDFVADLAGIVLSYVNRRTRTVEPNPGSARSAASGRGGPKMRYADAPQTARPERRRRWSSSGCSAAPPGSAARTGSSPCTAACRCFGQWLTFFARPGRPRRLGVAAGHDRGAGRALGDRAEQPRGRQPGRAARLDRPGRGPRRPARRRARRGPAAVAAGRPEHRPVVRQRDPRPVAGQRQSALAGNRAARASSSRPGG